MRKFLVILIVMVSLLMVSCVKKNTRNDNSDNTEQKITPKYKQGDIIYLKSDSTKCVIWAGPEVYDTYVRYLVSYQNSEDERKSTSIRDCEIY